MKYFGRKRESYSRFRRHRSRRSRRRAWIRGVAFTVLVLAIGAIAWYFAEAPPDSAPRLAQADAPRPAATPTPVPGERTAALPALNLPADEAPHGSAMEWWYYNGILDAADGPRYAFHVAVFVASSLVRHTVMHVALTDLRTGKRYDGQYKTAGVASTPVRDGFDFRQANWRFASLGGTHVLQASLDGGAAFALDLADAPPLVAHRAAGSATPGLLDFGSSGISYYYSRPRLPATGTVAVGGQSTAVRGTVWFDHQWGEFDVLELGWNWFALHLSDGSDLMIYELFDRVGRPVMTAGTHTLADGTSTPLTRESVQLQPVRQWTSPATGIKYPVGWRVQVPAGTLDVEPFVPNAEFDAGTTSANVYWEGAVKASGALTGQGFLELSGYERLKGLPARTP
ncbi:MAG: lipocalin family protein [Pseudomonadota bacterium]|nr:lipocalin family protein [Pseudomonadota bacterium]